MSERSTYVTDLATKDVAERVAWHLEGAVQSASVVQAGAGERFFVAGWISASAPGMEWEMLSGLEPLPHGPRLVINCECTKPILWDLAMADFAAGILAE